MVILTVLYNHQQLKTVGVLIVGLYPGSWTGWTRGQQVARKGEEKVYTVEALEKHYYQLGKKRKMYGAALPENIRTSEDWKFEFRNSRFIENKTWHIRAIAYPRGELKIELSDSDIYGNGSQYTEVMSLFLSGRYGDNDSLLHFIGETLSTLASMIELRYERLISQLPKEAKELSQRILELLKSAEFEKDELRGQINVWMTRESERTCEVIDLEKQLRNLQKTKRDQLHDLQRTIEREARNLYNTRTFLAGSKTIKGIRERLMGAISEEALGKDSIHHDHEPPEDLMPKQKKPVPMPKGPVHTLAKM